MDYANEAAQYANQYKVMCDFTQPFTMSTNMELTLLLRHNWLTTQRKL